MNAHGDEAGHAGCIAMTKVMEDGQNIKSRAEQSRAGQSRAGQSRAEQHEPSETCKSSMTNGA